MSKQTHKQAFDLAMTVTRGHWQRSLLQGVEPWSLAGLKGKARDYGSQYNKSRTELYCRMCVAGVQFSVVKVSHERQVLVFGWWASERWLAVTAERALLDAFRWTVYRDTGRKTRDARLKRARVLLQQAGEIIDARQHLCRQMHGSHQRAAGTRKIRQLVNEARELRYAARADHFMKQDEEHARRVADATC